MPAPSLLFDESHGQGRWFGASPTVDKGYSRIADLARAQLEVAFVPAGSAITPELLQDARGFVLAMGPQGKTRLGAAEMAALHGFVRAGGGLLVLGAYTGDWHHEANLNELLGEYGMAFNRDVILPAGSKPEHGFAQGGAAAPDSPHCVDAAPVAGEDELAGPLCHEAAHLRLPSACSLYVDEDLALPLYASVTDARILEPVPLGVGIHIQKYQDRGSGPATLVAVSRRRKVVAAGGWKLFIDAFIEEGGCDNRRFFLNLLDWLVAASGDEDAPPARPAATLPAGDGPAATPEETEEAGALQERLRRMRALLANAQKLALTAGGMELAKLQTDIDELEGDIRAVEAELDRLHGEG